MNRSILFLSFMLTSMFFCQSQTIEMARILGGYKFTEDGNNLSIKELASKMEMNQEAFALIKKARVKTNLSSFLSMWGWGCIGVPLGQAIVGREPDWVVAGFGIGILVIDIPLSSIGNKQAKEAVEIYNASLNANTLLCQSPQFELVSNLNGLGLSIRF